MEILLINKIIEVINLSGADWITLKQFSNFLLFIDWMITFLFECVC